MQQWPPDVPDFLAKKPRQLEKLEKLPPALLNAMTKVEMNEKIQDVAESLAKSYYKIKKDKGTYEECFALVSGALKQTGSSIGGQLGAVMVGTSQQASEHACRIYYPHHPFPNELEF